MNIKNILLWPLRSLAADPLATVRQPIYIFRPQFSSHTQVGLRSNECRRMVVARWTAVNGSRVAVESQSNRSCNQTALPFDDLRYVRKSDCWLHASLRPK